MARYVKKPVVVDAVRWTGDNWAEVSAFLGEGMPVLDQHAVRHDPDTHSLIVNSIEGQMRLPSGDWLIRGVRGEYYPCRANGFAETYDQYVEVEEVI